MVYYVSKEVLSYGERNDGKMKREELEKYLGKKVKITLFDGEIIEGELHKTGEEQFKDDPDLYIRQKMYFCINPQSCLFRSSHVIKVN